MITTGAKAKSGKRNEHTLEVHADRVVIRRSIGNKALGAATYLLAGPFLGAIFGLLAAVGVVALLQGVFKVSDEISAKSAVVVGALFVIGGIAWAIRDFRRHASAELIIASDRLELYVFGRRREMPVDAIDSIRLCREGRQICVDLTSGKCVRVPMDFAPAGRVLPHLNTILIPNLVRRSEAKIREPRPIVIRDLGPLAIPIAIRDLGMLALGICALPTIHGTFEGIRTFNRAIVGLRQCARGLRGGFIITAEGVQDLRRTHPVLSWTRIEQIEMTDAGIRIARNVGSPLVASPYAHHFCELDRLFESFRSEA